MGLQDFWQRLVFRLAMDSLPISPPSSFRIPLMSPALPQAPRTELAPRACPSAQHRAQGRDAARRFHAGRKHGLRRPAARRRRCRLHPTWRLAPRRTARRQAQARPLGPAEGRHGGDGGSGAGRSGARVAERTQAAGVGGSGQAPGAGLSQHTCSEWLSACELGCALRGREQAAV
jgi:hypothetical protein